MASIRASDVLPSGPSLLSFRLCWATSLLPLSSGVLFYPCSHGHHGRATETVWIRPYLRGSSGLLKLVTAPL